MRPATMSVVRGEEVRERLCEQFRRVRQASVAMCRPLEPEMYRVQPMEDVSPPWWNLGHTTWFFVRNLLEPFGGQTEPRDDDFDYVLNSYYASLGPRIARAQRGWITRPTTQEIYDYRSSVDRRVERLVGSIDEERLEELAFVLTIGVNHEQQHQELFYTEIKYILAQNPPRLRQPYLPPPRLTEPSPVRQAMQYREFEGGLLEFGHGGATWCWDNERPVHKYYLPPFALADRLVTNAEYREFVDDGGYTQQLLWLDNGWSCVQQHGWRAPLYWEEDEGEPQIWTLSGTRRFAADEPVCHISFYEADAFARWRSETYPRDGGARLPSEREWELAAQSEESDAPGEAFLESGRLHPASAPAGGAWAQRFGVLWQWTASYYEPYPGYRPFPGSLAEYNGKFMDNQRVLRGGSCVTPRDHLRVTYRNFWAAPTRFQFTGVRLAHSLEG